MLIIIIYPLNSSRTSTFNVTCFIQITTPFNFYHGITSISLHVYSSTMSSHLQLSSSSEGNSQIPHMAKEHCTVAGCPEFIMPSMWLHLYHMTMHKQGLFPGDWLINRAELIYLHVLYPAPIQGLCTICSIARVKVQLWLCLQPLYLPST